MEWDRHADQMHILDCLLQLMANRGLSPKSPEWHRRYKARKPQDFMPGDYVREEESKPKASITSQLNEYAKVYCGINNK